MGHAGEEAVAVPIDFPQREGNVRGRRIRSLVEFLLIDLGADDFGAVNDGGLAGFVDVIAEVFFNDVDVGVVLVVGI